MGVGVGEEGGVEVNEGTNGFAGNGVLLGVNGEVIGAVLTTGVKDAAETKGALGETKGGGAVFEAEKACATSDGGCCICRRLSKIT